MSRTLVLIVVSTFLLTVACDELLPTAPDPELETERSATEETAEARTGSIRSVDELRSALEKLAEYDDLRRQVHL